MSRSPGSCGDLSIGSIPVGCASAAAHVFDSVSDTTVPTRDGVTGTMMLMMSKRLRTRKMLFKFMESMPIAVDEESTSTRPLERTVLTFERRHGPLPLRPNVYGRVFMVESKYQNQKIPCFDIEARLSLMDPHEGNGSLKWDQLLKEQCLALERLARLYGSQFALWSPSDNKHCTRVRLCLTKETKVLKLSIALPSTD
ncbi:hypothetical protein AAF712_014639 [Marasmius tenuissimus]|uniref:Uncharacterized protein n=1 Tax=Marasmius tenuissimus TaxID=585030 RepID=A0ABR2ZBS9_9AGAR